MAAEQHITPNLSAANASTAAHPDAELLALAARLLAVRAQPAPTDVNDQGKLHPLPCLPCPLVHGCFKAAAAAPKAPRCPLARMNARGRRGAGRG
jgi:hypothetical protein